MPLTPLEKQLRDALDNFVKVMNDPAVTSVFAFYSVHGQTYSGPKVDMDRAKAALASAREKEK